MSKKRIYSSTDVENLDVAEVVGGLTGASIVAVDVAKTKFVAGIATGEGALVRLVRFEHPRQTRLFLQLLEALRASGAPPTVVMEPTGTYGDVLAWQCVQRGMEVRMVAAKHTHDAEQLFDGVPSMHDAKAATVLARLAAVGRSRSWGLRSEQVRDLRATVEQRRTTAQQLEGHFGRLEALLARHWPELGDLVNVREQRSCMALLAELPGPEAICGQRLEAAALLRRASRGALPKQRIEEMLDSAEHTLGLPMTAGEQRRFGRLVGEMQRFTTELAELDAQLTEWVQDSAALRRVASVTGNVTTAVLVSYLGELDAYASAAALEKACGLNLKEHSSGTRVGKLRISKRGPGVVRHYLYLAALRLLMRDPLAAAWYRARESYAQGARSKAVLALVRKLVRALWHVARGADFDSRRLFDARRLSPAAPTPAAKPRTRGSRARARAHEAEHEAADASASPAA